MIYYFLGTLIDLINNFTACCHIHKKKIPFDKNKEKNNESHPLWDSGALPNEVTKEKRGAGLWGRRLQPGASASCRELPSQCFRANGGLESTPLDG